MGTAMGMEWDEVRGRSKSNRKKQKVTNIEVKRRITNEIGAHEPLLEKAKRRNLQWFGHITRKMGTLAFDIMHGSVEGSRGRGRPKRIWLTDIGEWTEKSVVGCIREAQDRGRWRKIVDWSKCPNSHQATGVTWRDVIDNLIK
eukprot:gene17886-biopygen12251